MATFFKSVQNGKRAEDEFEKILISRNIPYKHANAYQDMREHWDYQVTKNNHDYTFNVKGQRGLNREGANIDYSVIWVEFKNVGGNEGWLYGKADYFSFEYFNKFINVKRVDVLELSEKKVDFNNPATDKTDALYRPYGRKGRKDLISLIKIEDIFSLNHTIWEFISDPKDPV